MSNIKKSANRTTITSTIVDDVASQVANNLESVAAVEEEVADTLRRNTLRRGADLADDYDDYYVPRRQCDCDLTPDQRAAIYQYLGCICYQFLRRLRLPPGHPSLNRSLLALVCGRRLPRNHPSIREIICRAFRCDD